MLVFAGFLFFSVIYCAAARYERRYIDSTLARVAIAGVKRVAGTAAVIGAVFAVVQIVMWVLREQSWAHTSLLNIENALIQVRRIVNLLEGPSFLLVTTGILLILLLAMPTIGLFSNTPRRILTATNWLARVSLVLTIVTSLTFYGTGSKEGIARLEAKLVEERDATTRGLTELEETAEEAALTTIVEAMVASLEETGIIQQIVESIVFDDLTKPYPFLDCLANNVPNDSRDVVSCECLEWDRLDSGVAQVARNVGRQVALRITNASVRQFTRVESELENIRTQPMGRFGNESRRSVNISASWSDTTVTRAAVERSTENLRNLSENIWARVSHQSTTDEAASTIRNVIRHGVSISYDGAVEAAMSSVRAVGEETAVYNFVELFVDESLHEPIRKIVRSTTEHIMDRIFVEEWTGDSLTDELVHSMTANCCEPLSKTIGGRAKTIADGLQNYKRSLGNLITQHGAALATTARRSPLGRKRCLGKLNDLIRLLNN